MYIYVHTYVRVHNTYIHIHICTCIYTNIYICVFLHSLYIQAEKHGSGAGSKAKECTSLIAAALCCLGYIHS